MKISELFNQAKSAVGRKPDGLLAGEVMLSYCLGISREKLYLGGDIDVEEGDALRFFEMLGRFMLGEPLAYLIGHKEFYGLDFFVDKRVLTPRPETEILVEQVIKYAGGRGKLRILDLGTGSGCIAIALAKNIDQAEVEGCDVSEDALEVAKINAQKNGMEGRVRFFNSDLMEGVAGEYDIIAANLPYIGTEKNNFISANVQDFEPHVALFGGSDGLSLYEKFFGQVRDRSWKPGLLAGEFGFAQVEGMEKLIGKFFPDANYHLVDDYASIPRVFMVNFC